MAAESVFVPPVELGTARAHYENVVLRQATPCSYCGRGPTRSQRNTVDHVVARCEGGENTLENIAAACRACNGEKGSRSLLLFFLARLEGRS